MEGAVVKTSLCFLLTDSPGYRYELHTPQQGLLPQVSSPPCFGAGHGRGIPVARIQLLILFGSTLLVGVD